MTQVGSVAHTADDRQAIWMAQDALNETVRSRVSEADLAAADAVLRAVFPEHNARQQVDERMSPPSESPLSGTTRRPSIRRPGLGALESCRDRQR
jgi:hypothetical protein